MIITRSPLRLSLGGGELLILDRANARLYRSPSIMTRFEFVFDPSIGHGDHLVAHVAHATA